MSKSNGGNSRPHQKKRAMLAALAETGNVTEAALAAEIDRCTHYKWLNADPAYAENAGEAMEQAADHLETEARRRAVEGVSEPLMYQGAKVGSVLKYSDTLLIFLLKAVRPDKYRENRHVELSGEITFRQALAMLREDRRDVFSRS